MKELIGMFLGIYGWLVVFFYWIGKVNSWWLMLSGIICGVFGMLILIKVEK
jgi:hypothetical protein